MIEREAEGLQLRDEHWQRVLKILDAQMTPEQRALEVEDRPSPEWIRSECEEQIDLWLEQAKAEKALPSRADEKRKIAEIRRSGESLVKKLDGLRFGRSWLVDELCDYGHETTLESGAARLSAIKNEVSLLAEIASQVGARNLKRGRQDENVALSQLAEFLVDPYEAYTGRKALCYQQSARDGGRYAGNYLEFILALIEPWLEDFARVPESVGHAVMKGLAKRRAWSQLFAPPKLTADEIDRITAGLASGRFRPPAGFDAGNREVAILLVGGRRYFLTPLCDDGQPVEDREQWKFLGVAA